MSGFASYMIAIALLPLGAFVIQILIGKYLPREGDWVSILAIVGSFLLALNIFISVLGAYDPEFQRHYQYVWINLDSIDITMGLLLDNLTAVMLVIVTGVSMLIHFYSVGYMHGEGGYYRFFAYLSLFTFSMLGIVLTDNLFGLFIFWELVGLSSFFLIGFWYEKKEAANASKKAFLTTRVGDLGMFLGILMLVWYLAPHTNTPLAYETIFKYANAGFFSETVLTAIGIMLFFGAVGKSAQMPLHVWLPDAMEGPTPVSALIHAATMVAAGVYMVARITPFLSPQALLFIAYVGGITAFLAASVALVKNDIKKVLAYSTVSQLGYMFLALGVGGWVAGILHLTTHAFFKALLFMGSGSIIHAVHSQDMRDMGGLWTKMPATFYTYITATLAISGIPFFSGFYSKEKILASGLLYGWSYPETSYIPYLHLTPFILGMLAAGMTAFYMFRTVFMTFFGEPGDSERVGHAHESPLSMTIPMIILAIFCLGFFFKLGPGVANKSHNSSKHQKAAVQKSQGLVTQVSTAEGQMTSTEGDHSKSSKSGEHSGGHAKAGWFEVLIQNPTPLVHYTQHQHHRAKVWTEILSYTVAGFGILLAAYMYAAVSWLLGLGAVLALLSFVINYWLFALILGITGLFALLRDRFSAGAFIPEWIGLKKLLSAKYYFDELYRDWFVTPTLMLSNVASWVDSKIIDGIVNLSGILVKITAFINGAIDTVFVDGLVNGIANFLHSWGDRLRRVQTGEVQWYINMVALGLGLILLISILAV